MLYLAVRDAQRIPARRPHLHEVLDREIARLVEKRDELRFFQSHFGSMASPWNRSRRPSKSAFSVETASDFPNRRGRAMKNCFPLSPEAIAYNKSVLSTYTKPFSLSSEKV